MIHRMASDVTTTTEKLSQPRPMTSTAYSPVAAPSLEEWRASCRRWLSEYLPRCPEPTAIVWGQGDDDVSVFPELSAAEEDALLERAMGWQQTKYDAGYGAISWPLADGGAGLPVTYERAFAAEEQGFVAPAGNDTLSVTVGLIAPTVRQVGTADQRDQFVRRFRRADELCCQLFSEPVAGSDLAGVATRAERDGAGWRVNGQKVWTSGAQFAAWGELVARTDPDAPKHRGLTVFLLPMDSPGVEVRLIRQMSGGATFCEVFLTDVWVSDDLRLGEVGQGWRVALTTLGFEREHSALTDAVGGSWEQVLALARWLGKTPDPVTRQDLAGLYIHQRLRRLDRERAGAVTHGDSSPGPEGSIGKLAWTEGMTEISAVVSRLLGSGLVADTGCWGTFAWTRHLLGAPGYRIAGGSDEIQRNIISERLLGLPPEPRVDHDLPWRQVPRS